MAENKFIQHLKGESTAGSLVEIKNQSTPASFGNMPQGTSEPQVKYADVRGDVTVVANGTMNWKISNSNLVPASVVLGDGQDFTSTYSVSGAGLWVNATYTFPSTGDPNHPVAMIFNPNSKWVLKLCGDNLVVDNGSTVDLTLVITFGTTTIISKQFTIAEQANQFCKELVIDFAESNANMIKAQGLSTMKVQVLCGTANASARIYNGMTVFTVLQRKVDAAVVSNSFANVEEALRDGILPSDYFNNAAFINQVEDGEQAYAVFERDGDTINLAGWTPKDAVAYKDEVIIKAETMPTSNADLVGAIYQYTGVTSAPYEHGYIYECKETSPSVYGWERIDVQPGGSRGRFLALWNCATGLAESNPPISPYEYKTGDYFIVGAISSATPAVNYKPDGTSYIINQASTTVETNEVAVDDTYFFDGTTWRLQSNSNKTVTYSNIAGDIYDSVSAANALNAKANTSTVNAHIADTNNPHSVTKAQVGLGKVDNTSDLNKPISTAVQAALDTKQDTLTAGTDLEIVYQGLPSDYAELEYIAGTSNVQYINTGIAPTTNMKIYVKCGVVSVTAGASYSPFGSRETGGASDGIGIFIGSGSNTRIDSFYFLSSASDRWQVNSVAAVGDVYETTFYNGTQTLTKNGTSLGSHSYIPVNTTTQPMYVNALNNAGVLQSGQWGSRIYRFTVEGICNLIPAKRISDGVIGMYDTIRRQFFTNAGTGSFTAGPVVNVPSGYQKVEYIESDGTQYIDTGVTGNLNTKYEITVQASSAGKSLAVFGSRTSATENAIMTTRNWQNSTNQIINDFGNYQETRQIEDLSTGLEKITFINDKNSRSFYNWSTQQTTTTTTTYSTAFTTPTTLRIGQADVLGGLANVYNFEGKIFGCKIWNNGTLVRNFVPVVRSSDSKVGMFDTVNQVFYANTGTGDFVAGDLVQEGVWVINFTNDTGYITGIDSTDVTTALGYTPVNPSNLATVATTGDYDDLLNKPTIPTVNDATLTITQGGVTKGTFTANASSNVTIALDSGGSTYSAGSGIDITSNVISVDDLDCGTM